MKKNYLLFLFFTSFFFSNLKFFPQSGIVDSLKLILTKEPIADSTKAKTLIALAWEIKYDKVSEAIKIAEEGIELSKKTNRFADIATGLKILGIINDETFHFKESIDYYLNSISYYQKLHDTISIARVEGNIGMLYRKIDQNLEAIKYFRRCMPVFKKANFILGINITNQNMGISYFNLKNYDSALVYFFRSLEILKANNSNDPSIYGNIGNCSSLKNDKVKAEKYLNLCVNNYIEIGDSSSHLYFWKNNLANIYVETGRKAEGIKLMEECKIGYKKLGLIYSENNAKLYVNLAINYAQDKKFELAYKNILNALTIKDTLFNKDFAGQMSEMKEKYEADKNELSISNLNKEKKLKDIEIKQQSTQKYALGAGLLLMLILSFVLYKNFTQKKKDNLIIQHQKHIVEEKNKEITDSITYAKRLQDAILPSIDSINELFPESFVYYQPKDIVAGDFYFIERTNTHTVIAAADCTGHGVPGALVSVVCSNALSRSIKEFNLTEPGKILDKTRELVIETFEKSGENVKDGMDISLCTIETKKIKEKILDIKWAGANNPFWYCQDGEIKKITADKQPIGKTEQLTGFVTHSVQLKKGDLFYLFTDGFADQFGGPKGKKFKYKQLEEQLLFISGINPGEQKNSLASAFNNWKGNLEQVDDVCIIGIKL